MKKQEDVFTGVCSLPFPDAPSRPEQRALGPDVTSVSRCVCVCVGGGLVEEEKAALGRGLRTPAGALQSLPGTMQ